MKDQKVIKELLMSKLGENPVLSKETLEDIRIKTLEMGETLEEKEFENTLCNVELELKKLKDPQAIAGVILYCMSQLPISFQKVMLEGQESIINTFLVHTLTGLLFEDMEEFEL